MCVRLCDAPPSINLRFSLVLIACKMSATTSVPDLYIYELPHAERTQLCILLDQNNAWEDLAGTHMKYDFTKIYLLRQEMQRGRSPSDELLTLWGHQNHTVLELFILLYRMKHYQAMNVVKRYVDPKYHKLISVGRDHINVLVRNLKLENDQQRKDKQIPAVNLDGSTAKCLLGQKSMGQLLEANREAPAVPVPERKIENYVTRDDNPTAGDDKHLKPRSPFPPHRGGSSRVSAISDISCVAESAGAIPQIPYEELQRSTNDWNEANVLGKGGFGTVFKGTWKCTQVAIKRIEQKENNPDSHSEQIKQSITELHCLNAYRHDNILPLYGYSVGGPQPCLVYQYMSGGCLERRLRVRDVAKVLKWRTRLEIAIGTARGLQYLHTIGEKPLIHGDIKSANILLDRNDVPRIGDFGLAREGPQSGDTHLTVSRIHGTMPYLPNEFLRGSKLSTKVDTYSFGIVLFELATALGAFSESRKNKFLKDHVVNYEGSAMDLKDKRAPDGEDHFKNLINIGMLCVMLRAKERPEMVDVLIQLERAAM